MYRLRKVNRGLFVLYARTVTSCTSNVFLKPKRPDHYSKRFLPRGNRVRYVEDTERKEFQELLQKNPTLGSVSSKSIEYPKDALKTKRSPERQQKVDEFENEIAEDTARNILGKIKRQAKANDHAVRFVDIDTCLSNDRMLTESYNQESSFDFYNGENNDHQEQVTSLTTQDENETGLEQVSSQSRVIQVDTSAGEPVITREEQLIMDLKEMEPAQVLATVRERWSEMSSMHYAMCIKQLHKYHEKMDFLDKAKAAQFASNLRMNPAFQLLAKLLTSRANSYDAQVCSDICCYLQELGFTTQQGELQVFLQLIKYHIQDLYLDQLIKLTAMVRELTRDRLTAPLLEGLLLLMPTKARNLPSVEFPELVSLQSFYCGKHPTFEAKIQLHILLKHEDFLDLDYSRDELLRLVEALTTESKIARDFAGDHNGACESAGTEEFNVNYRDQCLSFVLLQWLEQLPEMGLEEFFRTVNCAKGIYRNNATNHALFMEFIYRAASMFVDRSIHCDTSKGNAQLCNSNHLKTTDNVEKMNTDQLSADEIAPKDASRIEKDHAIEIKYNEEKGTKALSFEEAFQLQKCLWENRVYHKDLLQYLLLYLLRRSYAYVGKELSDVYCEGVCNNHVAQLSFMIAQLSTARLNELQDKMQWRTLIKGLRPGDIQKVEFKNRIFTMRKTGECSSWSVWDIYDSLTSDQPDPIWNQYALSLLNFRLRMDMIVNKMRGAFQSFFRVCSLKERSPALAVLEESLREVCDHLGVYLSVKPLSYRFVQSTQQKTRSVDFSVSPSEHGKCLTIAFLDSPLYFINTGEPIVAIRTKIYDIAATEKLKIFEHEVLHRNKSQRFDWLLHMLQEQMSTMDNDVTDSSDVTDWNLDDEGFRKEKHAEIKSVNKTRSQLDRTGSRSEPTGSKQDQTGFKMDQPEYELDQSLSDVADSEFDSDTDLDSLQRQTRVAPLPFVSSEVKRELEDAVRRLKEEYGCGEHDYELFDESYWQQMFSPSQAVRRTRQF